MPEYTAAAVAAAAAVVAAERWWFRTGLFRRPAWALTMAVCFGFMIPVNGWLTKLRAPVVVYSRTATSGLRFPWDIPVEDFLFGFALLNLVLLLWERGRDAA